MDTSTQKTEPLDPLTKLLKPKTEKSKLQLPFPIDFENECEVEGDIDEEYDDPSFEFGLYENFVKRMNKRQRRH